MSDNPSKQEKKGTNSPKLLTVCSQCLRLNIIKVKEGIVIMECKCKNRIKLSPGEFTKTIKSITIEVKKENYEKCVEHNNNLNEYYCFDCLVNFCENCIVKHRFHCFFNLDEYIKRFETLKLEQLKDKFKNRYENLISYAEKAKEKIIKTLDKPDKIAEIENKGKNYLNKIERQYELSNLIFDTYSIHNYESLANLYNNISTKEEENKEITNKRELMEFYSKNIVQYNKVDKDKFIKDLKHRKKSDITHNEAVDLFNKGKKLENIGKSEEALINYTKSLELDPTDSSIYFKKSQCLVSMNRFDDALINVSSAIEIEPKSSNFYIGKGICLSFMKNYDGAIKEFDKALQLDPNNPLTYFNKGQSFFFMGKHDEALQNYDKGLELDPKNINLYITKGECLSEVNKYDDALKCYNKAIEINPNEPGSYYFKGLFFNKNDKYNDGLVCFNKVIEIDPKSANGYIGKGICLTKMEKYDEALKNFDKAGELNPNHPDLITNKKKCLALINK